MSPTMTASLAIICMVVLGLFGSRPAAAQAQPTTCEKRITEVDFVGRDLTPYAPNIPADAQIVATTAGLRWALLWASHGAVIVLEDGVYDLGRQRLRKTVTLIGRSRNGAILRNTTLVVEGPNSRIEGLRFEFGAPITGSLSRDRAIEVAADDVEVIDNHFHRVGEGSTIKDGGGLTVFVLEADRMRVQNNLFSMNHGLAVKTTDLSRDIVVTQNDFIDSTASGGVGEIIQIGNAFSSDQATPYDPDDTLNTVVSHNHVCNWRREQELVSIKGDGNTVIGNLIEGSRDAAFVIRMGNDNLITGNVMVQNQGVAVRISGERNRIEYNIFEGTGIFAHLHSEVPYPGPRDRMSHAYWAAHNNTFKDNTLIGYDRLAKTDKPGTWDWIAKDGEPAVQYRSAPQNNRLIGGDIWTKNATLFTPAQSDDHATLHPENVDLHSTQGPDITLDYIKAWLAEYGTLRP